MEPKQFRFILWAPIIMGAALVAGLWLLGTNIKDGRVNDTITVTGSVKKSVVADYGKWHGTITHSATLADSGDLSALDATLQAVSKDAVLVKNFAKGLGLDEQGFHLLPVATDPQYEQLPNYVQSQRIIGYTVRQEIEVESADVNKIEELSTKASQLVKQNVAFTNQNTEYYYQKLAELRPELFAQATRDAKERAEAIARGTGVTVGAIRSARTGVIQVLRPNSTDVSDYGSYDLSTKEKEVSAVVTVSFALGK